MVVRAEHVQQALEATFALVEVVGNVGREVGLRAVFADHDPVLLIAELGRPKPGRAVLLVKAALAAQACERAVDRAVRGQRPLREEGLELDAEVREPLADAVRHPFQRQLKDLVVAVRADLLAHARDQCVNVQFLVATGGLVRRDPGEHGGRIGNKAGAVRIRQGRGELANVVTAVAVRGEGQRLAMELEVAQPGRQGEDVDLPARVIHVVLAADGMPGCAQQRGQRRAVGRLAAVADVQRPGRVG